MSGDNGTSKIIFSGRQLSGVLATLIVQLIVVAFSAGVLWKQMEYLSMQVAELSGQMMAVKEVVAAMSPGDLFQMKRDIQELFRRVEEVESQRP